MWDGRKREERKTGIVAVRVRHASYQGDLWVVIVRRGGEPWYLVTNRCIEAEEQAWECYQAYCRRWQVETVFRYEKSELAIETIRIWKKGTAPLTGEGMEGPLSQTKQGSQAWRTCRETRATSRWLFGRTPSSFGFNPRRRRNPEGENVGDAPHSISQLGCHRRSAS